MANEYDRCVREALSQGRINQDLATQILEADNPNEAIDELLGDLTRQKREVAIQAVRASQAYDNIKSHPEGMVAGITALMTKDPRNHAGYKNIEYLAKYYSGLYQGMNSEALAKFRSRMFGVSNDEEGLVKWLKAIYGEDMGEPFNGMAKSVLDTFEEMRLKFNQRGGSISKNEKYLMPQRHDMRTVAKAGEKEWKSFIYDKLDRQNMLNKNGKVLTDEEFDLALSEVYETISTGGLNKAQGLTDTFGSGKLSRRHGERRFLYFKDADSWMAYQNRFGRGNVFDAITDQIDMMSNDIAVMEVLGPNPSVVHDFLVRRAQYEDKAGDASIGVSNAVYRNATGQTNGGDFTGLADALESSRNFLTAANLGGAFISAISDVGFQYITAKYNKIAPLKVIMQQLSLMRPGNEQDRIFGTRLGLTAENASRQTSANRFADSYGTGKAAKLAEWVLRASGLEAWTNAGRKAFGMEYSALLADNFKNTFDDLAPELQQQMRGYGISVDDWDVFRSTPPLMLRGAPYADVTQEAGVKFHQMILSETDFAVPTPDARTRGITTGGLNRASGSGMAVRTVMQLKSFPITILMTHGMRGYYQATKGQKAQYYGSLMAITTILGGITLQAKDLAAGREPRPMLDEDGNISGKFLIAAMSQGGGLGIFGDFIFSDQNRFGSGPAATVLGPTGDTVDRFVKLTLGNAQQMANSEETNVIPEAIDFVGRYFPDPWQVTILKNAMFDQLEILADEDAQRKYNRIVRKRMKDYNQGYWWKPGEPVPEAFK